MRGGKIVNANMVIIICRVENFKVKNERRKNSEILSSEYYESNFQLFKQKYKDQNQSI